MSCVRVFCNYISWNMGASKKYSQLTRNALQRLCINREGWRAPPFLVVQDVTKVSTLTFSMIRRPNSAFLDRPPFYGVKAIPSFPKFAIISLPLASFYAGTIPKTLHSISTTPSIRRDGVDFHISTYNYRIKDC